MGRVISLQLHEGHGKPMRRVETAAARVGGGIEGDSHAHRGKRALVVVDRSTLDAVGIGPGDLREQITVDGLPALGDLAVGARLRLGPVTIQVNGPCDPCEHIGEMNGVADPKEFEARLAGRRGIVGSVVAADGPLRVGDAVDVLEATAPR